MAESYRAQMREEDFTPHGSASQPVGFGTYDQLAALASWLSLALPGRGGIGNPADPLRKLVQVLMQQERPVGKQRIPGDLSWVAARKAHPDPPRLWANIEPGHHDLLEFSGRAEGGATSPGMVHMLPGMDRPDQNLKALYTWLMRKATEKPDMSWRQDPPGRFRF